MLNTQADENAVLIKAFNNSCSALGLSRDEASAILGVDRATLARDQAFMQHWLRSDNKALSAKPVALLHSVLGLVQVNLYLDAMRGKV